MDFSPAPLHPISAIMKTQKLLQTAYFWSSNADEITW